MLILLDIDGVMVTTPSWKKPELLEDGFSVYSTKATINLQRIISHTNASIVLTTSHKSRYSISQWEDIFRVRGIDNVSITKLGDNTDNLSRRDEILLWLDGRVTNEPYVIIDDDKSLNGLPEDIKKRFVLTDSLIGLDEDISSRAIRILTA